MEAIVSNNANVLVNLILGFSMKYLALVLGFGIIFLGYKLLKAGVKGEFTFKSEWLNNKADLASTSPGLLFVLLGVFLMCYALFSEHEINVKYQIDSSFSKNGEVNDEYIPNKR
jgi:hypothetical protein